MNGRVEGYGQATLLTEQAGVLVYYLYISVYYIFERSQVLTKDPREK